MSALWSVELYSRCNDCSVIGWALQSLQRVLCDRLSFTVAATSALWSLELSSGMDTSKSIFFAYSGFGFRKLERNFERLRCIAPCNCGAVYRAIALLGFLYGIEIICMDCVQFVNDLQPCPVAFRIMFLMCMHEIRVDKFKTWLHAVSGALTPVQCQETHLLPRPASGCR